MWSAVLSPAAFVALSEEDEADGKTPEEHMLEASRAEIAKELPDNVHGITRVWKGLLLGIDCYIIEPVATVLRFFHLVIIFVPVIGTLPIIFIGARQKSRDNERSGTLWWYSFLVQAMEWGGPAFIKVLSSIDYHTCVFFGLIDMATARPMGGFETGHLPHRNVQCDVFVTLTSSGPLSETHQGHHSQSL